MRLDEVSKGVRGETQDSLRGADAHFRVFISADEKGDVAAEINELVLGHDVVASRVGGVGGGCVSVRSLAVLRKFL